MKWKPSETVPALLILAAATLACLIPFIDKAFHIDDPLFIWTAKHIQTDPVHFYDFKVNWDGRLRPMAAVTQNPPLASYYMAMAASVLGWSEIALHTAFLLPGLALVLGTFSLARRLCAHPLAAALLTLAAPVFLLSSTSVMCDTMMLALWIWSLVFWMDGLAGHCFARLWLAGVLISACCLTKYFGIALLPLLLVYSLLEKRRIGPWLFALGLPVVVLVAYQWLTYRLYGRGLLFNAMDYATHARVGGGLPLKIITGLSFTGGSICVLLPLAPWLWNKKHLITGFIAIILSAVAIVAFKEVDGFKVVDDGRVRWLFVAEFSLLIVAGASLLVIAFEDWRRQKTPASALLLLWVGGTYFFAAAVNWTVSGRNILPMLPAASILLVRRLELRNRLSAGQLIGPLWIPLGFSAAIGLLAARADYQWANSARQAAGDLRQKIGTTASGIWYEGHWGFQYYIEQQGGKSLNRDHLIVPANAAIIVPLQNSYHFALPADQVEVWFRYECEGEKWMTTMNTASGAGYYSDGWGPLPFAFCHEHLQQYPVLRVK